MRNPVSSGRQSAVGAGGFPRRRDSRPSRGSPSTLRRLCRWSSGGLVRRRAGDDQHGVEAGRPRPSDAHTRADDNLVEDLLVLHLERERVVCSRRSGLHQRGRAAGLVVREQVGVGDVGARVFFRRRVERATIGPAGEGAPRGSARARDDMDGPGRAKRACTLGRGHGG